MKLKFKVTLVLLTGTVFFYASCKKSNQTPAQTTISAATASGFMATNFERTLSGNYGGININNGLILPSFSTKYNESVSIGADLIDLCSFYPDTLLNYSSNISDTIKSQTHGVYKFFFSCDTIKAPRINGYPNYTLLNGYNAYYSLTTAGAAPRDSFVYNIEASYTVKALDTVNIPLSINGSTNKLLSVAGDLKSYIDAKALNKSVLSTSVHVFYTLTGITVDLTKDGDITSGTAVFAATGNYNNTAWQYNGAITFLGSHKANVVINGKTYVADLLTAVQ